jgi:hypothetical protein
LIPNKHGKDIAEDLSWNISSKFKPLVEQDINARSTRRGNQKL